MLGSCPEIGDPTPELQQCMVNLKRAVSENLQLENITVPEGCGNKEISEILHSHHYRRLPKMLNAFRGGLKKQKDGRPQIEKFPTHKVQQIIFSFLTDKNGLKHLFPIAASEGRHSKRRRKLTSES